MNRMDRMIVLLVLMMALIQQIQGQELVVKLTKGGGEVQGFSLEVNLNPPTELRNHSKVYQQSIYGWRGIPYAQPPVGPLRWLPPSPALPWTGVRSCLDFGSPCMQPNGTGSEDCLFLNVYTTAIPSSSSSSFSSSSPSFSSSSSSSSSFSSSNGGYPVLFYIHGGGLDSGSGADNDWTIFMARFKAQGGNMVVVQLNYRLNLFGYLALSELSAEQGGHSGNYGLQDQLLALQWVQDNIAAFGGDPTQVTVAGQSSGGTSIFALLSAPKSRGLFAAAISMSGSTNLTMSLASAEVQNAGIVSQAGCASARNDSAQVVACLRALPASAIVPALYPAAWNMPGIWGLPLSPAGMGYQGIVIVDGHTVTQPFLTSLQLGLIDIPIVFGNMGQEPDASPDVIVSNYTLDEWKRYLETAFEPWGKRVGEQVYNLYFDEALDSPQKAYDSISADFGLTCSAVVLARAAKSQGGKYQSPMYVYLNQWALEHPYLAEPDYYARFAHHFEDLWMVTENWNLVGSGNYQPGSRDIRAAQFLQSWWFNFITSHRPLSSWHDISDTAAWPDSYSVFQIDPSGSFDMLNLKSSQCNFFRPLGIIDETFWWCD